MLELVKMVLGVFTGSAGPKIGGAVSGVAQVAAVIAALTPLVLWLRQDKDVVFISITYGELAFWGGMLALVVLLTVRLVHNAPAPRDG